MHVPICALLLPFLPACDYRGVAYHTRTPDIQVTCGDTPSTPCETIQIVDAVVNRYLSTTITIQNPGRGVLQVEEITTDDDAFAVEPSSLSVSPGAGSAVAVSYLATDFEPVQATLTIVHNAPGHGTTIPLQATTDTDADDDGHEDAAAGGDDCNDQNARVNPSAAETWYDSIDQDCDGESDWDQDGDGHETTANGGEDCNDRDAAIKPDARETWYDGVDQDCADDSDFDADGDGYDSDRYRGDDCDDADVRVHPGAADTVGDGEDQDCDGIDG